MVLGRLTVLVYYFQSGPHDVLVNVRHVKFYVYYLFPPCGEWSFLLLGVWIASMVLLYTGAVTSMHSGLSGVDMPWWDFVWTALVKPPVELNNDIYISEYITLHESVLNTSS